MAELSAVMEYYDKDRKFLLAQWRDELHRQQFGISATEATSLGTDLAKAFDRWCGSALRQAICERWNYCEKKKVMGKDPELAAMLSDLIATTTGFTTNGAITVAILLMQHGFDAMCRCEG